MITEAGIKAAIRNAPNSGKAATELRDDGARGEGRLVLTVRVIGQAVTSEWYAVWYREGGKRRHMAKLGAYPTMGLAEARKEFREEFAPKISRGENPTGRRARKEPERDVEALFTAYVEQLKADGKPSWETASNCLLGPKNPPKGCRIYPCAADVIGRRRAAGEVKAEDVVPHLAAIHQRGSVAMASAARAWISAAFEFGMKSANAYHREAGGVRWGIVANPVRAIPHDPNASKPGQRFLRPAEFRDFWAWLDSGECRSKAVPAAKLVMLCGSRPGEILRLGDDAVWDRVEKTLFWPKTKNGSPHLLPLPERASAIIETLMPNRDGLLFWSSFAARPPGRTSPLDISVLEAVLDRYLKDRPTVERFTPRDLRRTWKTLAGAAGLSKEIRDRLQNHSKGDISSKHYDRYEYLAEKRAAMKVWDGYVERMLSGQLDNPVTEIAAVG